MLTDIVTKKLKDKGDVQVVLGSPSAAASSLQTLTLSEPATTPVPSGETAATAVPSASSAGDVNNQLTEAYQHLNKGNKKVGGVRLPWWRPDDSHISELAARGSGVQGNSPEDPTTPQSTAGIE